MKKLLFIAISISTMYASDFKFDIPNNKLPEPPSLKKDNNSDKVVIKPVIKNKIIDSKLTDKYVPNIKVKNKENDAKCSVSTLAMTFQNLPTQKGPHFNRWASVGCQPDEVSFIKEGNEQVQMEWIMTALPKEAGEEQKYMLKWEVKTKENNWSARHVFDLEKPRTLSLVNNMSVTIRRVK